MEEMPPMRARPSTGLLSFRVPAARFRRNEPETEQQRLLHELDRRYHQRYLERRRLGQQPPERDA
jgi:hypothetical protein